MKLWHCGLAWLAVCLGGAAKAQDFAIAGFETQLSLSFSSQVALSGQNATGFWVADAHLQVRYSINDLHLELMLDPALRFAPSGPQFEAGIGQASILYRTGGFDISLGIERLALETARLSLPYSLEPLDAFGRRLGVPGLRLAWNPEQTRLRLALLWLEAAPVAVLSLRREFDGYELEAHALYRAGRLGFGLGGSGTLERFVLYAESWLLTNPLEPRFALGVSGALGDGLWTLEGGYAALGTVSPRRFVAGQLALPALEDVQVALNAALLFDDDALRGSAGVMLTQTTENGDLTLAIGLQFGPPSPVWAFSLQLRGFLW